MFKRSCNTLLAVIMLSLCTGCTNPIHLPGTSSVQEPAPEPAPVPHTVPPEPEKPADNPAQDSLPPQHASSAGTQSDSGEGKNPPADSEETGGEEAVTVVADPDSITVLLNKHFALPKDYRPQDLIYPAVPFLDPKKNEKHLMRKEAAQALEKLFAAAKKDGITLMGVSAFRSYTTQEVLFNYYVKQDGEEKARTYSAVPGTSEHQTGLAIDVSGTDRKCAAADCFAGTKEAKWLEQHAAEYGFIIRYPLGKEAITGYQYEPWHIRYVGKKIAEEIMGQKITLEEYLHQVPVSK
ncbi:M15 family metallopeptidase [Brevibacillus sp. SYP-B805]|uniref:M15 family metallopeptidase n=1 Tax=Brevibacillus sp. SYP-B805 TaxID=1578199 RepID=UPI0013ED7DF8|nr:M15 family metallopeptidase [Brevibacillus sp. SYP-B805]NGQ94954.1 M15 family metallopeptidase [Brevibacillus sp. SYP-B805]